MKTRIQAAERNRQIIEETLSRAKAEDADTHEMVIMAGIGLMLILLIQQGEEIIALLQPKQGAV